MLGILDEQDERGHCPRGAYLMGETKTSRWNKTSDRSCDGSRVKRDGGSGGESQFGQVVRESLQGDDM